MKRIRILGEEYEAEQIERKQNEVTGRTGGKVVFRFAGIRDMNTVELLDGAEYDAGGSVEEEVHRLRQDNDLMKKRLDSSEDGLLSLMDITVMGGM